MTHFTRTRGILTLGVALVSAWLTGCAVEDTFRMPPPSPESVRARIAALMPDSVRERGGWATDIYDAFTAMKIAPTPANACAVLAVVEQESTYQVDPVVPNLAKISREEIFRRADRAGAPEFAVRVALQLKSSNGKTYDDRLAAVRTEHDLSVIYEDFIGNVPLGKQLFEGWNPVHTAGPMQVSIGFAEQHAKARPYPHPMPSTLRHEVFTRRGGLYFGIAHLLDYPAPYGEQMLYRFADFNAGRLASRNAAFQNAVGVASGRKLDLDGDFVAHNSKSDAPGQTLAATLSLATALGLSEGDIRAQLAAGEHSASFDNSTLYARTFALADRKSGRPLPRALVPRIVLQSPKITRRLTTEWFAQRVNERFERCLARSKAAG